MGEVDQIKWSIQAHFLGKVCGSARLGACGDSAQQIHSRAFSEAFDMQLTTICSEANTAKLLADNPTIKRRR